MILRIKELRKACGLNQAQLGLKVGVAQNTVSMWESENGVPSLRQLPAIARALNCSINDLFEQPGQ